MNITKLLVAVAVISLPIHANPMADLTESIENTIHSAVSLADTIRNADVFLEDVKKLNNQIQYMECLLLTVTQQQTLSQVEKTLEEINPVIVIMEDAITQKTLRSIDVISTLNNWLKIHSESLKKQLNIIATLINQENPNLIKKSKLLNIFYNENNIEDKLIKHLLGY